MTDIDMLLDNRYDVRISLPSDNAFVTRVKWVGGNVISEDSAQAPYHPIPESDWEAGLINGQDEEV